jgi:hypothetical protein
MNVHEQNARERKARRVVWKIDARLGRADPELLEAAALVIDSGLWGDEEWAAAAEDAEVRPLSPASKRLVIDGLRD